MKITRVDLPRDRNGNPRCLAYEDSADDDKLPSTDFPLQFIYTTEGV